MKTLRETSRQSDVRQSAVTADCGPSAQRWLGQSGLPPYSNRWFYFDMPKRVIWAGYNIEYEWFKDFPCTAEYLVPT